MLNPKRENEWKIIDKSGETITDELEVAEAFNEFFITKVEDLKRGIDEKLVEDPFVKLKEKMTNNKGEVPKGKK